MALLMIDLSRIEMLNPVLGYRKTSHILDAVQTKLLDIKRPSDILSRVSDHRFALIIPDLKFSTMIDLAVNKIIESIGGLRSFTGMEISIYPSTGVALFPDNGRTAQELLLGADTAAQATPGANTWTVHAGSSHHEKIYQSKLLEPDT